MLSYYLSRDHAKASFNHRWAVDVATISLFGNIPGEPLRFDIEFTGPDLANGRIYLRAYSMVDRHEWNQALLRAKRDAQQAISPQERFRNFVSLSLTQQPSEDESTESAPTSVSASVIGNLADRFGMVSAHLTGEVSRVSQVLSSGDARTVDLTLSDVTRSCTEIFELLKELENNSFTAAFFGHALTSPKKKTTVTRTQSNKPIQQLPPPEAVPLPPVTELASAITTPVARRQSTIDDDQFVDAPDHYDDDSA